MSGEVDYRRYAGSPSTMPKYLSDSLTPLYGYWNGTVAPSISYSNLSVGDVVAKIVYNAAVGWSTLFFAFNTPQRLNGDYELDFWLRTTAPPQSLTCHMVGWIYWADMAGPAFALPTATWLKHTYQINRFAGASPFFTPALVRNRTYSFYLQGFHAANPWDIEICGVTLRRL